MLLIIQLSILFFFLRNFHVEVNTYAQIDLRTLHTGQFLITLRKLRQASRELSLWTYTTIHQGFSGKI